MQLEARRWVIRSEQFKKMIINEWYCQYFLKSKTCILFEYLRNAEAVTSNISLSNMLEMKFGPSVSIMYNPNEIQKSVNMRTQTFGVNKICKYGGLFFPISFIGCFLCCRMCSFSSMLINLWSLGSSLTKKNQQKHQTIAQLPPM